jgi:hypothetical protein
MLITDPHALESLEHRDHSFELRSAIRFISKCLGAFTIKCCKHAPISVTIYTCPSVQV